MYFPMGKHDATVWLTSNHRRRKHYQASYGEVELDRLTHVPPLMYTNQCYPNNHKQWDCVYVNFSLTTVCCLSFFLIDIATVWKSRGIRPQEMKCFLRCLKKYWEFLKKKQVIQYFLYHYNSFSQNRKGVL